MAQYELNLYDYVRILLKRKTIIIGTALIVTAASFFFTPKTTPIYEARSTIKIELRQTVSGMLTEWMTYNPANIMESHSRLIRGYPIMKKTAIRLGLISESSPVDAVNKAVKSLQGSISTKTVESTNVIEILARSPDPQKSMNIANAAAQVYIDENLFEKNKQSRSTRQFIEEQLSTLETRLREAEDKMRQYGDEVKDIGMSEPIQKKLTELQFELVNLEQKYTEKHPEVIQAREQIKLLENQLKGFSGKELEYARLSREVEVNRKLYALLKEKLEEARITEAQKVGDIALVDPAITPVAPVPQSKAQTVVFGIIFGFVLGLIIAFVTESLDTSIATIEDVESVTKTSVLGVIPVVKQKYQEKQKTFVDKLLEEFFPGKAKKLVDERFVRLVSHFEPKSVVAESYRTVRTNMKITPQHKTFLITSTGPQEGKTAVLINLGIVIAQTGLKTLLVSTDLRRPTITKTFGIKHEPGFHEVLTKKVKIDDALLSITDIMLGAHQLGDIINTPGLENISILPTGRIPSNPSELLESKESDMLIAELKKRFDVILFDSPPVLPVTDAVLLSRSVDGVVLVYEVGRVARSALLRAKTQIESSGAKVAGIVLNHITASTSAYSSYPYYYYQYKKYYGDDSRKVHAKA